MFTKQQSIESDLLETVPNLADRTTLQQLIAKNGGNSFSEEQLAAIRFPMNTHLRIIAGAGSGKTQTICAKAAYLVLERQVDPKTIMMCTFSRKAKLEMEARINQYLGGHTKIAVQTFHGWFNAEYNELTSQMPHLKQWGIEGVIDEEQYYQGINQLIKKYRLYNFDKFEERTIASRISYWRNMGYSDQAMVEFVAKYFDAKELIPNQKLSDIFQQFLAELAMLKKAQRFITFDDMLFNLKLILENDATARQSLQKKYRYIFIDEFQDINPLQKQIVALICPPDKATSKKISSKLIIVGDDDQSIYYFRGAEPNYIKEFEQEYQQTSLQLMTNYRSDAPIVAAGNRLIQQNAHDRLAKRMTAKESASQHDCYGLSFSDDEQEASWIGEKIQELAQQTPLSDGSPDYRDTMVLYPTRIQLRSLLKQLTKQKIPFVTPTNDDLLGIFGLPLFKTLFQQLTLLDSATSMQQKNEALKTIIQQYAFYHYIKFGESAQFSEALFRKNKFKINDLVAFLVSERKLSQASQDQAKEFFKQIYLFYQRKYLNLGALAEALLATPKFKKDLSEEEVDWLRHELSSAGDWPGLLSAFQQASQQNKGMKKRLNDYDQEKLNAVYLLSIHASKGLGKKNIFIKGVYQDALPNHHAVKKADCDLQKAKEEAAPPTTIEEQRRLMYVAITRAKENLYITFPKTINNKSITPSPFLKEAGLSIKDYSKAASIVDS
ncbi:ATP-dependent helicase [Enterococcus xiangfangensis]|uniref:ATP-dependent helicase n=1 Tax=Enterococcus xiangfangensis TaxID=1296537 RepID=UPI0010F5221F|nr:ATP-dependent helicase [Enterococcus xiangfangensis]MBM7712304.1 DNA helicase-2/ATP-dependent DNA helicase PcrA [Enterococcus xiangfangensis]